MIICIDKQSGMKGFSHLVSLFKREKKNSLSKSKNNCMSIWVVCVCVYMCRIVLNYVLCGCVCVEMCSVMLYCAGVVCNVGLLRCCVSVQ